MRVGTWVREYDILCWKLLGAELTVKIKRKVAILDKYDVILSDMMGDLLHFDALVYFGI